jgi:hypothetical protein
MKYFLQTCAAAIFAASTANACIVTHPELQKAVRQVLVTAENPQISGWAGYLNDGFYAEMACRLSPKLSASDVYELQGSPEVLVEKAAQMVLLRNQSDALMLILSAMQSTRPIIKD